jgi:hypothetical protein
MVDHLIGCPTPYIVGLHRKILQAKDEFPIDIVKVRELYLFKSGIKRNEREMRRSLGPRTSSPSMSSR